MKTLYLDVFSGLSGDMFLGAMIDLGVDLHALEHELEKLGVRGYHLHASRRQNSQIEGTKFDVHLEAEQTHAHAGHDHGQHPHDEHDHDHDHDHEEGHAHHHHDDGHHHHHHPPAGAVHDHSHASQDQRNFAEIKRIIEKSTLSDWVKRRSIAVFQRIATAEGKIHGRPAEAVHFHEVGAIDSIIDIVGACVALELLGQPRVISSPVIDGTGWVQCAHGRFPVPAPATLEILAARQVSLSQCEEPHELITPTGAALLAEFAESFGPIGKLTVRRIGYGLGTRENKTRPNLVRVLLGEASETQTQGSSTGHDWETDTIAVLESNIDDCNGEILGFFVERALAAGALDVFHTPIQMKKNRPGVLLTVLCPPEAADEFTAMLLRETSSFGVRRSTAERRKLRRTTASVQTPYGTVTVKFGKLDGAVLHATPEFESCKQAAAAAQVPLAEIYRAAEQAARETKS